MWVQSLGQEDSLKKEMATHSSVVAVVIESTQSCLTLCDHGLQHTRLPYLSPSPRACPNSRALSW